VVQVRRTVEQDEEERYAANNDALYTHTTKVRLIDFCMQIAIEYYSL
jgi:hypothetical protein